MNRQERAYRSMLSLFHANGKGNGAAMRLGLLPASSNEDGAIMAEFANQMTIADYSAPTPVYPRFDWENKITVKFGFDDLCAILQVMYGECESAGEGKGLFHKSSKASTRILFRHVIEPACGYQFEIHRTTSDQKKLYSRFQLSAAEARGLSEAISGAMSLIAFGAPVVTERAIVNPKAHEKKSDSAA